MSSGWSRLEELFEAAQAVTGDARAGFLDRACAGDAALRAEIEAMLAGDAAPPLAIEQLVIDQAPAGAEDDPWLGQVLGPWRLTRVIGRGGMGLVYGAVRADGQYQLEVAVKLMRAGPRDPQAVERFRTERQVLASLKHPNIAGLVDGGLAPDGTPYLVMELVDGSPITDWCGNRQLTLDARLRLFRVVCDAVQHAHRALVVHRDLKPTNIFVSVAGEAKLLDFGIAKLLEPDAWGLEAADTRAEMRVLSPDYAAPEQWHGGPVTTATDVYSLGVVLYELVTGVRPSLGKLLARAGAPTSVTPPSVAVRRSLDREVVGSSGPASDGAPEASVHRRRLVRRIRGDLDRIVLTALREEPDRRYVSAGQLGEEIGRFLEGRAVLAQPDTVGYRARKFVGRNRLAVAASAVFVVSLAVFAGVSAWQARVLAEQRRVAQLERDTSQQVVRLLIDLFQATNPSVSPEGDRMPVGEFLQGAQARSLESLREAPAVRAKLQQVFGLIHNARGQYGPARQALEEALQEQTRLAGRDHAETLETLQALGEVLHFGGDDQRARSLLEESLDRHRRAFGEEDLRTARALFALAPVVAAEDLDQAGELLRRSLEIRRARLAANHPEVATSLAALGAFHSRRGDPQRGRGFYRQALDAFPSPQDRRNPIAIGILNDFSALLGDLNEHAEAETLQREAIDLARQVLGPQSFTVGNLANNLATTQAFLGKHAAAERSFRAAYETHRSLLGEVHWRTRNVARNVGRVLALQRRYVEALPWLDRAGVPATSDDAGKPGSLTVRSQRAQVLFRLARRREALVEAEAAVAGLERVTTSDAARGLAAARVALGRMLIDVGRPRDAELRLAAALDWLDRLGPEHPQRAEASCELARARILQGGRTEDRQRLEQCLPIYRAWGLAEREVVEGLERILSERRRGR